MLRCDLQSSHLHSYHHDGNDLSQGLPSMARPSTFSENIHAREDKGEWHVHNNMRHNRKHFTWRGLRAENVPNVAADLCQGGSSGSSSGVH